MLKKGLSWLLKGGISIGLIAWVLSKVDLASAWSQAKGIDPWMLVLSLVLMLIQIKLGAVRWGMVLRALSATFTMSQTFAVYYMGVFFALVLPGAVGGDAMRMWFARRHGLSLATSVNSVMLERAVTVFGLVVLVVATQPLLLATHPAIPGGWIFPALLIVCVAGILTLTILDRLPESIRHWRVVRALGYLAADTRSLFFHPGWSLGTLVVAILGHANMSMAVWAIARGLDLPVTPLDCLVLVPPVILIVTMPISIAGWGVRETAMVTAFGFIGVEHQSAVVLSVLFGIVCTLTALPGGLVFLMSDMRKQQIPDAAALEKVEA